MTMTGTTDQRGQLRFDANLGLLATRQGGRKSALDAGYRSNVWFGEMSAGGEPVLNACQIETLEPIKPGAEAAVTIVPLYPAYWADVEGGTVFALLEGLRTVGTGTVSHAPAATERLRVAKRHLAIDLERWIRSFVTSDVVLRPPPDSGVDFELVLSSPTASPQMIAGEFKAAAPEVADVHKLAGAARAREARLGLLIGLSEPSRQVQRALFSYGTEASSGGRPVPRLLYLSLASLARRESWWFLDVKGGSGEDRSATLALAA